MTKELEKTIICDGCGKRYNHNQFIALPDYAIYDQDDDHLQKKCGCNHPLKWIYEKGEK